MNLVVTLCLVSLATFASADFDCSDCPLEGEELEEAKEVLTDSLSTLAAGAGPSYTLVKINSATSLVVAGVVYNFNAVLKDKGGKVKTCDVEVLYQPWLPNGVQVTFKCPGEKEVTKKHNAKE